MALCRVSAAWCLCMARFLGLVRARSIALMVLGPEATVFPWQYLHCSSLLVHLQVQPAYPPEG